MKFKISSHSPKNNQRFSLIRNFSFELKRGQMQGAYS